MSEIYLEYMVPVIVTVDTATQTVTSVNVDDENTGAPIRAYKWTGPRLATTKDLDLESPTAKKAINIAEHENTDWPAWEFGW